jgi:hypothetical protein
MVIPKFVEIAENPFAFWFLNINEAGDTATIEIATTITNMADLIGFRTKTQIAIPTKPESNNLGWKKETKPIVIAARVIFLLNTLLELEVKS